MSFTQISSQIITFSDLFFFKPLLYRLPFKVGVLAAADVLLTALTSGLVFVYIKDEIEEIRLVFQSWRNLKWAVSKKYIYTLLKDYSYKGQGGKKRFKVFDNFTRLVVVSTIESLKKKYFDVHKKRKSTTVEKNRNSTKT